MALKRMIQAVMDRKTGKESLMDSKGRGGDPKTIFKNREE